MRKTDKDSYKNIAVNKKINLKYTLLYSYRSLMNLIKNSAIVLNGFLLIINASINSIFRGMINLLKQFYKTSAPSKNKPFKYRDESTKIKNQAIAHKSIVVNKKINLKYILLYPYRSLMNLIKNSAIVLNGFLLIINASINSIFRGMINLLKQFYKTSAPSKNKPFKYRDESTKIKNQAIAQAEATAVRATAEKSIAAQTILAKDIAAAEADIAQAAAEARAAEATTVRATAEKAIAAEVREEAVAEARVVAKTQTEAATVQAVAKAVTADDGVFDLISCVLHQGCNVLGACIIYVMIMYPENYIMRKDSEYPKVQVGAIQILCMYIVKIAVFRECSKLFPILYFPWRQFINDKITMRRKGLIREGEKAQQKNGCNNNRYTLNMQKYKEIKDIVKNVLQKSDSRVIQHKILCAQKGKRLSKDLSPVSVCQQKGLAEIIKNKQNGGAKRKLKFRKPTNMVMEYLKQRNENDQTVANKSAKVKTL